MLITIANLFNSDVTYNYTSQRWACCGKDSKGDVSCSDPTGETFDAPAPSSLSTLLASGPTPTTSSGSSTLSLTPTTLSASVSTATSSSSLSSSTSRSDTQSSSSEPQSSSTPSSTSSSTPSEGSTALSAGAKAGIGIGAAFGSLFIFAFVYWVVRHCRMNNASKSRKRNQKSMVYNYVEPRAIEKDSIPRSELSADTPSQQRSDTSR